LEAARTASAKQDAIIETLQEQVKALQTEVDESRRALEALRADHANDSDIIATAEMDRQALVKARADLEAIKTETAALNVAQTEALDAATAKINALEDQASRAEALTAEIDSLHAGKEETSNKLSELEIEILELKEARDLAEEERGKREAQIDALHGRVAAAGAAADEAVQEAAAKESAAALHLEEVKKQHEAALALVVEDSKQLTEQLRTYQAKIDELHNNLGDVNAAAANAAAEHARRFAEAQQAHQTRQNELAAEIEKISAELAVRWHDCIICTLEVFLR
jgi:chromosome segregation ATPase